MYSNIDGSIDELARVLSRIDDGELAADLLRCLLTRNELREIAGRWELVKLLDRGVSQRTIARELGMSLCKITRGSKELHKPNSAFKKVLDIYLRSTETNSVETNCEEDSFGS